MRRIQWRIECRFRNPGNYYANDITCLQFTCYYTLADGEQCQFIFPAKSIKLIIAIALIWLLQKIFHPFIQLEVNTRFISIYNPADNPVAGIRNTDVKKAILMKVYFCALYFAFLLNNLVESAGIKRIIYPRYFFIIVIPDLHQVSHFTARIAFRAFLMKGAKIKIFSVLQIVILLGAQSR